MAAQFRAILARGDRYLPLQCGKSDPDGGSTAVGRCGAVKPRKQWRLINHQRGALVDQIAKAVPVLLDGHRLRIIEARGALICVHAQQGIPFVGEFHEPPEGI